MATSNLVFALMASVGPEKCCLLLRYLLMGLLLHGLHFYTDCVNGYPQSHIPEVIRDDIHRIEQR